MSACLQSAELRLVVLGRTGAGKRSAVSTILGLDEAPRGAEGRVRPECSTQRGEAAGRRVAVVSSPAWFGPGCDPEDRRRHISSFITLSRPGPHAFLLCVPVNQPAEGEAEALRVLKKLFGAAAVEANTIVLFTHTEELEEEEQLEDYLSAWRKDLKELVEACGEHYHTLEPRGGAAEEAKAVEELLEKVERAVRASGEQHCGGALYREAEEKVRERQVELVRQRRGGDPFSHEGDVTEEEMEGVRDEAERSAGDLNVDVEGLFPRSLAAPAPSFLWGLWGKLTGWTSWLPRMMRVEALLGALVSLFVGGPLGGAMGATVGSVATEVGRRRTKQTK
ncbi:GTPase IMAP family member 7 [Spinachia spinachia]